jgi:transmembrane sensor
VLLDDDPDDAARRAEFEAWLDAAPLNRDAWQAVGRTAALLPAADGLQRSPAPSTASVDVRRPAVRWRTGYAFGVAALALCACILAIVGPTIALRLQADHHTGVAEVQTLRLDDGSSVRMGPGSALRVAFSSDERRIQILAGEALFDVTADATRPFRVVTRDAITTVLGTRFDVSLLEASTSVVVARGHTRGDRRLDGKRGRPAGPLRAGAGSSGGGSQSPGRRGHRADPAMVRRPYRDRR